MPSNLFFEMIKSNAILYSILVNENFLDIESKSPNISTWSNTAIEISKVPFGQDLFDNVLVVLDESSIRMDFRTQNPTYFDEPTVYFGIDVPSRFKSPYTMGGRIIEEEYKDLGNFNFLGSVVSVKIRHYNLFGYTINLIINKKGHNAKYRLGKRYFVGTVEVPQEVLYFFKPEEVVLHPTYSHLDYAPKIEILIRQKNHPFKMYLERKANLFYSGKLYGYGQFPKIAPLSTKTLRYAEEIDVDGRSSATLFIDTDPASKDHLLPGESHISYEVVSPQINFFKIGDKVLNEQEIVSLGIDLERDYVWIKTLFGKEASDEFGDPVFAGGISLYKLKKKSARKSKLR
jgi:hypothetical protein